MARYKNGRIPPSMLVHMGGEHWATVGTKQKIEALIADIWKNERVRVWVTSGPNIYRDYANQVSTKNHFVSIGQGYMAAAAGHSSHGGEFNGDDALAADFSGYGPLGITKWYAYLRKHGFEAGYFDGQNGRPYEPWHAIDWDPYRNLPALAGESENDDMTPEERKMLTEVHTMMLEVRGALGASGGHNMPTRDTIGHKVNEMRDYLGAAGGKGTKTPDTIGYKITQMFKRTDS